MNAAEGLEALSKAMQEDEDFAWSWFCNVAMVAVDAGAKVERAHKEAASFMSRAFGVDVTTSIYWETP